MVVSCISKNHNILEVGPLLFITECKVDPYALGIVQKSPYATLLEFTFQYVLKC